MDAVPLKLGPRQQVGAMAAPMHVGLAALAFGVVLYSALHHAPDELPPNEAPFSLAARFAENATEVLRPVAVALNPGDLALAHSISRRYRIASEAAESLVRLANNTGREISLDPQLILAVIAIESRFNPIAESDMGAKGLMQVIPKLHPDKFGDGGVEHSLFPASNVLAGARVLKDYIRRSGSLENGLQWYNGAPWDEGKQYAQKILAERARYQQVTQARPLQAIILPASPAAKPVPDATPVDAAIDVARLDLPAKEIQ